MKKARMVGIHGDGLLPAAYTAHHLSLVGSDHVPISHRKKKKSLSLASINHNKCYRNCYMHICQLLASPFYSYYYVSSTEECWRPQNTAFVAMLCCLLARGAVSTIGSPVSVCLSPLYCMYAGTGTVRDWALPQRRQFQKTTLRL